MVMHGGHSGNIGEKPPAAWIGKERHNGEIMGSLTVIFRTGGCSWGRCRMCGYRDVRYPSLASADLAERIGGQIRWVMDRFDPRDYRMVKIYSSGSVFDPMEVPPRAREMLADAFRGKIVIAETRPEYVEREAISAFIAGIDDGTHEVPLLCAMGLETADDAVREKSIDKGFSTVDYLHAVGEAHRGGAGVKTYLLLKPLFLTEQEGVEDVLHSVAFATDCSQVISLNPCTVQSGTEMEALWRKGAYRPPYLWSVLHILRESGVHLLCDPVGGGYARGPHNCRGCDRMILAGIREYSLNADRGMLEALWKTGCTCREEWEFVMQEEKPYCMPLTR